MDYCVYGIFDPITNEAIYIGITNNFDKRIYQHSNSKKSLLGTRIRSILREGKLPVCEKLEIGLTRFKASTLERIYINFYNNNYNSLYNLTIAKSIKYV